MILPQVIKGYEVHEKIGGGGFGEVYRGYQPAIPRNVAIKIIKPDYASDENFIRRFDEEARYVARLEHPHIIPLYDYWRDPGGAYLVMRYVRGGSLRERIKDSLLTREEITDIVTKIGNALSFSHRNDVIHLDLKPENVLLDEEGNPYLTDFGIARGIGQPTTGSNIFASIPYSPPEHLTGAVPTPAMDIYSLGIIIFELLAGKRPFESLADTEKPLPNICDIRQDLRPKLNNVLQKACAKEASERYSDIRTLLEKFNEAIQTTIAIRTEPVVPPPHIIINPYKGLKPFEEADADTFFGREELVEKLVARLQEDTPYKRFLAVVGPSGSGKSSVVRAGLIPTLRQDVNSTSWFIRPMVPGNHPLSKLEAILTSIALEAPADLTEQLRHDEFALAEITPHLLQEMSGDLLLVIDHFEEIFTLVENEDEVRQFLRLLYHAITDDHSRLRVVVALRSDFYDNLIVHPQFAQLMQERTHIIVPMSADELTQAIRGPSERVGLTVDANLMATMIADVSKEPGALPLLQYALTEIFDHRDGKRLTLAAYQNMGGIVGALSRRAEKIYQGLSIEQQDITQKIFLQLAQFNQWDEITRYRIRRRDLTEFGKAEVINKVLDTFEDYDLLIFDNELGSREPMVEVAHEAIFASWQRLRDWLAASRDDLRLEQWLREAAAEWEKSERDSGLLARGARLQQLKEWAERIGIAITGKTKLGLAFLKASIEEEFRELGEKEAQQQRELGDAREKAELAEQLAAEAHKTVEAAHQTARVQRRATVRLGIAVAFLAVVVVVAIGLWLVAQRNAQQAQSLALAFQAQSEFSHDNNDEALRLAVQSVAIDNPPAEAQTILIETAYAPGTVQLFEGFSAELDTLALSRDGRLALVGEGSQDDTPDTYEAQLWDMESGTLLQEFAAHTDVITGVAFSPDGRRAYTASKDGSVRGWDITEEEAQLLVERGVRVRSIAISPDGQTMLIGGGAYPPVNPTDYDIWLVDTATGATICELTGHTDSVFSLAFSPDGRQALSSSGAWESGNADKSLRLWDVASCTQIRVLVGHEDVIQDIAFSLDGQTAVTASADHTLFWWDLTSGEAIRRYGAEGEEGHTDWVNRVVMHPNGRWMLSGGWDNQLILWDLWTGDVLHHFIGHTGPINGVALSPDGDFAYSVSDDKTMRVWQTTNDLIVQRFDAGAAAAMLRVRMSPNQDVVLSGDTDGILRLWDIASERELWRVQAHTDRIYALAFSPDGQYVVSGGADNKLYLWDVVTGRRVREFRGLEGRIWMVDYSPDGRYIVSGSDDQKVRVWEAATGAEFATFAIPDYIYAVAFSPDNQSVLAGGLDKKLYLLDIASETLVHIFEGHIASINAVDFSPDGRYAVSGGYDNHLIVWDIANQQQVIQLEGHFGPIWDVDFSADGATVISGAADRTLRIWDWREGAEQGRISHNTQILSVDVVVEAQQFVIGSQGAIDLIRLPDATVADVRAWIAANRYVPR